MHVETLHVVLIRCGGCRAYKEKQKAKVAAKKPAPTTKTKSKGGKAPKAAQGGGKAPGRVGGKR